MASAEWGTRMKGVQRGILVFLILVSVLHLGYSVARYNPITHPAVSGDFRVTFDGASDWRRTGSYDATGLTSGGVYYPPLYYTFLLPFTHFELKRVAYFFYFTQFILFYFAIVFLVKAASNRRRPACLEYLIATILALNFQPFLETLASHKVEGIEFFLICLAIGFYREKKDLFCGALIGLATHLKYLPGILIGYFLLKREFKVLLGIGCAGVLLLVFLFAVLGFQTGWAYTIQHPLHLLFGGTPATHLFDAAMERQTLGSTLYRWFAVPVPPATFQHNLRIGSIGKVADPRLAFAAITFMKVLLVGLYLYFIGTKRGSLSQRKSRWTFYLLEIALTLLMIFVVAQGVRPQYGILVLPSFVVVALLLYHRWDLFGLREKVLFGVAYSLSGMIIPGGLLNQLPPHPLWGREHATMYQYLSLPFYGYLTLGLCILLCYDRLLKWEGVGLPQNYLAKPSQKSLGLWRSNQPLPKV